MMNSMTIRMLPEHEVHELLRAGEINIVETPLAKSKEDAVIVAERLGFPVVLKVASPDITHKSDAGGVELNISGPEQVRESYDRIISSARKHDSKAIIDGVSIQKMVPKGIELIVGMSTDRTFGPMIMFGIGGVFVEVLKDVAFRIAPLSEKDAHEMIREIKGFALLTGFRGEKPVDVAYLENLLMKVSRLVEENPEIQELDLNPVIAYPESAVVVDARIVLKNSS